MPRDSHSRSRSRSPYRHDSSRPSKRARHHSPPRPSLTSHPLPFDAAPLTKHDLPRLRPLLALYLDVQKRLDIDEIDEAEVKGRWKSLVKKWNNGDLARGWYDPQTLSKALAAEGDEPGRSKPGHSKPGRSKPGDSGRYDEDEDEDEDADEDNYGPALPPSTTTPSSYNGNNGVNSSRQSATAPTLSDLAVRREDSLEAAHTARQQHTHDLKHDRHLQHKLDTERLDDLIPRAQAGTRDRQLEKRREVAASNKSFANTAREAGDVELRDDDVMGNDGLSEFNRMKEAEQRKKSEREVRREEVLRAKRVEREERLQRMREKEERAMQGLRAIAKERFG